MEEEGTAGGSAIAETDGDGREVEEMLRKQGYCRQGNSAIA